MKEIKLTKPNLADKQEKVLKADKTSQKTVTITKSIIKGTIGTPKGKVISSKAHKKLDTTISPDDLLKELIKILDDSKAQDITSIDLKGKTSIADHMIVASGTSVRQVSSMAEKIAKYLKKSGYDRPDIEGLENCDWVLVDCKYIIIHLFRSEVRVFYNIEKLWQVDFAPNSGNVDKVMA